MSDQQSRQISYCLSKDCPNCLSAILDQATFQIKQHLESAEEELVGLCVGYGSAKTLESSSTPDTNSPEKLVWAAWHQPPLLETTFEKFLSPGDSNREEAVEKRFHNDSDFLKFLGQQLDWLHSEVKSQSSQELIEKEVQSPFLLGFVAKPSKADSITAFGRVNCDRTCVGGKQVIKTKTGTGEEYCYLSDKDCSVPDTNPPDGD